MMLKRLLTPMVLALSIGALSPTHADHNSIWGEGWANMPNDIHDTRIDTLDDDTDTFIDFVRRGSGSASGSGMLAASTDSQGGGSVNRGGARGGRR